MDIVRESISDQWYNKSVYLSIFQDEKKISRNEKKRTILTNSNFKTFV